MMTLPSSWYAIASPQEFSDSKPNSLRRFGVDWVIWKSTQGWIAQRDLCPHRSAKLSIGKIKDDCIQCPFHGFEFNSRGECALVPEIEKAVPQVKVETYTLIEKHGFLWMPWRLPTDAAPPWFEEIENQSFTYSQSVLIWKKHFSRCVENQLDYAHLPFVHYNSIGRGFNPAREVKWDLDSKKLRVVLDAKQPGAGFFEFKFGNIWQLGISSKFKQFLAFVPVDDNETAIYMRSYHRFTQIPGLKNLIAWLSNNVGNPYIINQDHRVVMTQEPGDVRFAKHERLFASDQAIHAFRKWLSEE